jgi:uncharacterized membrane protein
VTATSNARVSFGLLAIAYVSVLVVFVAIDFFWLSAMANRLYRPVLGDILAAQPRLLPAVLFYLIFALALTHLAVRPALIQRSLSVSAVNGGMLGLAAYATYDLTNHATLERWTTALTVPDLIWGTVLSALSAFIAALLTRRFLSGS